MPKKRIIKGGGLLDKVLDDGKIFGIEIPEMHLNGFSGRYNFAGPGTKLHKRLDAYGRPLPHSKPINDIDRIAMQHDIDYELGLDKKIADKKMIEALDRLKPKNWREKADRFIVRNAIRTKQILGLGKKKRKNKKRKNTKRKK